MANLPKKEASLNWSAMQPGVVSLVDAGQYEAC